MLQLLRLVMRSDQQPPAMRHRVHTWLLTQHHLASRCWIRFRHVVKGLHWTTDAVCSCFSSFWFFFLASVLHRQEGFISHVAGERPSRRVHVSFLFAVSLVCFCARLRSCISPYLKNVCWVSAEVGSVTWFIWTSRGDGRTTCT